jgi:nucleotide-binding universal stress UspA family protein
MSVLQGSIIPYMSFTPFGGGVPVYPTNMKEILFKKRKKMLIEEIEEIKKEMPSLKISGKLIEGDPADRIIEVAETENFDLIVMGSSGVHGLKRLIFGSVSDTVRIESEVPILIVK